MKLKTLIKEIPDLLIKGNTQKEITGIVSNSKGVAPGNLFIAKKGLSVNGALFIEEAVAAGASCIVTDLYNPFLNKEITQLIHKDPALIEKKLASRFYDFPDKKLFIVGVTGTNGKTTTSYIVQYLLEKLGSPCGLIGTVEWKVGSHSFPSTMTSPSSIDCYKLFSDMHHAGCTSAAIEVSSHALDQGRLQGFDIDVVIFTNLTQDHLDYHKTFEEYRRAKARLFLDEYLSKKQKGGIAIINKDSPESTYLIANTKRHVITYGIENKADLQAKNLQLSSQGIRGELWYQEKTYPFSLLLSGRFNVYNALAALAAALARGFKLEEILRALQEFKQVPGRLEKIMNKKGLNVFVDYAHTDDALLNVLKTLREVTQGRVITVFGCGGARDAAKRPKMGAVAESYSDIAILTSDNPRTEEPSKIAEDVLQGIRDKERIIIELDRAKAIKKAIELATPSDTVLIAGKGHEKYQIFAHQTIPFDDCKEAEQALL